MQRDGGDFDVEAGNNFGCGEPGQCMYMYMYCIYVCVHSETKRFRRCAAGFVPTDLQLRWFGAEAGKCSTSAALASDRRTGQPGP